MLNLLVKIKKLFLNKESAAKRNLEELTGISFFKLNKLIEKKINQSLESKPTVISVKKSRFTMPGGSNNLGFILHALTSSDTKLLSKLSTPELLRQEKLFFEWHQSFFNGSPEGFAPEFIVSGKLASPEVGFITIEHLKPAKTATLDEVWELYLRSRQGHKFLGVTNRVNNQKSEGKIKKLLDNFIINQDAELAKAYISTYLSQRKAILESKSSVIDDIEQVLLESFSSILPLDPSLYGFVHGDFKKSNMLNNSSNQLLLIDFQYVCHGIKIWDMAFYLSKEKKDFDRSASLALKRLETRQEKCIFIICYILAVLLHPKKNNFDINYKEKIIPALGFIKKYKHKI